MTTVIAPTQQPALSSDADQPATGPAPRGPLLRGRWLATLLLLLGLVGAGVAAPATANAATYTTATVCFSLANGGGFGSNSAWTGNVNYQVWHNNLPWTTSQGGTTSGCKTYYVHGNSYIRFQGNQSWGSTKYSGSTPWYYVQAGTHNDLGRHLVFRM